MIITISGLPGSGKSTVSKILEKKLGFERIYVGGIRRELARSKGMNLEELNEYALNNPETDIDVDKEAAKQARLKKNAIVEGRTQFHFIPESIKVYLTIDFDEGAKRIWKQIQNEEEKNKRNEDKINSFEEMKKSLKKRIENDTKRYIKYYNLNCYDKKHYDLIINTTNIRPEKVADKILKFIKKN
jgi:CMP/dCMP kinase